MTNEWLEFKAYTEKQKYSATSKHDLSYLGRFSFKTITDFEGFGRILTTLARGYIFHNKTVVYLMAILTPVSNTQETPYVLGAVFPIKMRICLS